ncbi:MAG: TetR/AcrR family transcriptional regulator [Pseudomonadaceae bacterium]|nr:TetR/AcrR family transcriptional regulator [Pseudomonadaceae bacterium]
MAQKNKRAVILEAAASIVEQSGAAHLTIDAVAAAAGVSKGGVLYHFPSKQALLEGMLESFLAQIANRTKAYRDADSSGKNVALTARINEQYEQSPAQKAMGRAILAAAAEDPEMLTPAREESLVAFKEAAAGSAHAEMGWVLLLAVEGLRLLEMLKLLPLSRGERHRLHLELLELARLYSA